MRHTLARDEARRGTRRVRIAHAIHSLELGGAQQVIKYLVARGDSVAFEHFVYAGHTGVFHDEIARTGANVRVIPRWIPKLDPLWIGRLAHRLRADGIDVLHTHLFGDSLHGLIAARLAGNTPVIMTLHNSLEDFSASQRAGYRWMLPRATNVVACSASAGESFRDLIGPGARPIVVIPNGLDPAAVPADATAAAVAARATLDVPSGSLVIGALGRLVAQKGFSFLISAFRIVAEQSRTDVRLVLVGAGPEEQALRRQAATEGVANRVTFAGFRSDARELMAGFDVLVFSSLYEGLPMALLEGMANRRCIVATAVPGLKDIVTDGEDAILAAPRDPAALAEAIRHALGDEALRRRLGDAAHRAFQSRYTVNRMVAEYETLYRETLHARHATAHSNAC